ncbi:PRTRC system ThiF family protein [Pseudoduganella sp. UC29_106]|uniref:PRTRC system ThiF family protein n=1 Tax=Pseudoduganella sp. UC29_106 TaxID=3374553 RepID=UPI003758074A
MAALEHRIDQHLLDHRVSVHLAGVGGNGAQMASCLARLDIAIRALGHPHGLFVQAFDPDVVSEANVGRQLFSPSDVGGSKTFITMTRLNHFYGLDWEAQATTIEEYWNRRSLRWGRDGDILISCVDSRAARRRIHEHLFSGERYRYWLDLGNTEHGGQAVLGTPQASRSGTDGIHIPRLPCVTELYPELLDTAISEDNAPSCSVRLSLAAQGLFVNDIVVRHAAQLLYELFSCGRLTAHGVVCNLDTKRSVPMAIDPQTWERLISQS